MNTLKLTVRANPDATDCLRAAALEIACEYLCLVGYDLSPEWVEEREAVTLTMPLWIIRRIKELSDEAAEAGDEAQVELCRSALDQDGEALRECLRVLSEALAQVEYEEDPI